jgi:multiple sugar transport system substrate-binding protein
LLTGCFSNDKRKGLEEKPIRIGIYGYDQAEEVFMQRYMDFITLTRNDLKFELIYMGGNWGQIDELNDLEHTDAIENVMHTVKSANPPDVIVANRRVFSELMKQNQLKPLSLYIKRDRFDVERISEKVEASLKQLGDGQLYGLSPAYSVKLMFYNKQIYDKAGVPYPTDSMPWEQLFALVKRVVSVQQEIHLYGLSFGRESFLKNISILTDSMNLRLYDGTQTQMTVYSNNWTHLLDQLKELYSVQALDLYENNTRLAENPNGLGNFINGRVATTFGDIRFLQQLSGMDSHIGFEWGVATIPSGDHGRHTGAAVSLFDIMAINANATNIEGAWEFIKIMNGEQWAKLRSKSLAGQLTSYRLDSMPDAVLEPYLPLIEADTVMPSYSLTDIIIGNPQLRNVHMKAEEIFMNIIIGETNTRAGLKELQQTGNVMMQHTE